MHPSVAEARRALGIAEYEFKIGNVVQTVSGRWLICRESLPIPNTPPPLRNRERGRTDLADPAEDAAHRRRFARVEPGVP